MLRTFCSQEEISTYQTAVSLQSEKSGFIELSEFLSHQSPLMLDSAVDMVDSLLAQFLVSTNTFPHQLVSNSVLFPLVSVQCHYV